MKKVYIAGKITGYTGFKARFRIAESRLKSKGYCVMNPAELGCGFTHEEYMHVCYAMIDVCDTVYFLDNWESSKGARLEMEYAKSKGKGILIEGRDVI